MLVAELRGVIPEVVVFNFITFFDILRSESFHSDKIEFSQIGVFTGWSLVSVEAMFLSDGVNHFN